MVIPVGTVPGERGIASAPAANAWASHQTMIAARTVRCCMSFMNGLLTRIIHERLTHPSAVPHRNLRSCP
jgi:hypothetical protein